MVAFSGSKQTGWKLLRGELSVWWGDSPAWLRARGSGLGPAQAELPVPGSWAVSAQLGHSELALLPVTPCSAVPAAPVAAHTPRDPGGETAKSLGQVGMAPGFSAPTPRWGFW